MNVHYSRIDTSAPRRVALNAQGTLSRVVRGVLPSSDAPTGTTLPVDPFSEGDGVTHHRRPDQAAARIRVLEAECDRLQNIIARLRDEDYARQAANREQA